MREHQLSENNGRWSESDRTDKPSGSRPTASLTTLPTELLQHTLLSLPSLTDVRSTVLAHRLLHECFASCRTLILRRVFEIQTSARAHDSTSLRRAYEIVERVKAGGTRQALEDATVFQEVLWPRAAKVLPSTKAINRARSLIQDYKSLKQASKALTFANAAWSVLQSSIGLKPSPAAECFARELVMARWAGSRFDSAIDLQKQVQSSFDLHDLKFSIWGQEIVRSYRRLGRVDEAIDFETQVYRRCVREARNTTVALEWARHLVREYTLCGNHTAALHFQQQVLREVQLPKMQYVAWARHLITMLKRNDQGMDALAVKADVFHRLSPGDQVYYGWARELATWYHDCGQNQEALRVEEAVWDQVRRQWDQRPRDEVIGFHAKIAGRAVVMGYRECGRANQAAEIEARYMATSS